MKLGSSLLDRKICRETNEPTSVVTACDRERSRHQPAGRDFAKQRDGGKVSLRVMIQTQLCNHDKPVQKNAGIFTIRLGAASEPNWDHNLEWSVNVCFERGVDLKVGRPTFNTRARYAAYSIS